MILIQKGRVFMSKIRVAVIFGGKSNEHDVSVVSATHVIKSIPNDKYDVICIGITKKGHWMKSIFPLPSSFSVSRSSNEEIPPA